MSDNKDIGVLTSSSASESLREAQARKLGAGSFWNIIYLLNELDFLRLQERQVRAPLDEAYITKSLWWFYLQSGVSAGVLCGTVFVFFRIVHIMLGFVAPGPVNNAALYLFSSMFVYYLSTFLLPMITYHNSATTKAVNLVFEGGIGGLVLFACSKSFVVFWLIFYQNNILWWVHDWDEQFAGKLYWCYQHILGPGYVEVCFMTAVIIGGIAASINYKLIKNDLKTDSKRGRPYNRMSQDYK